MSLGLGDHFDFFPLVSISTLRSIFMHPRGGPWVDMFYPLHGLHQYTAFECDIDRRLNHCGFNILALF